MVYNSRGDFMQGFLFGRFAREHFLKFLGNVMNNIKHTSSTTCLLRGFQWRAAVQEFIRVGFAVEFLLDHLREIARAFFTKKVQPAIDVINAHIESLKKEVVDLEARRERFLFGVIGPSRFGDQTFILDL